MGSALEEESLFSLELFAETLSVFGVPCRFPALAFRLLDFPSLIINHVEQDLAKTIRTKIAADSHYKLGSYISELQDKHGNFIFKKGKSCLFKASAGHLCEHLSSTPLYVMLLDTYQEVPKLLGSFGIPLDSCMDNITNDIEKCGIATPSTQGEKGTYKIYNLMGALVGRVTMGFRLLSLGQGLLAHIPENAITKPTVTSKTQPKGIPKGDGASNDIANNLQLLTKDVQVSIPSARPSTQDQVVQTSDSSKSIEAAEQVKTKGLTKKLKAKRKPLEISGDFNDVFVNNIDCPPPLFFNSKADEPDIEHYTYGLTLSDNLEAVDKDKRNGSKYQDQKSSESMSYASSDEDTIRPEDKLDDSDAEDWVDFKASKIYKFENNQRPSRTTHSFHRTIIKGGGGSIISQTPIPILPKTGHVAGLPILNALLQEILALQGMQAQQSKPAVTASQVGKNSWKSDPAAHEKPTQDIQPEQSPVSRPVTPLSPTPHKHTHRTCASHEQPVPKNKSWLRSEPPVGIKKSKLTYGLTNTQRLRLAKANPQLLKTLEQQEALRLQNRRKSVKDEKSNAASIQIESKDHDNDTALPVAAVTESKMSLERSPRPPKPTPRLSRQWTKESPSFDSPSRPSLAKQSSVSLIQSPRSHTQSIDIHAPSVYQEDGSDKEYGLSPSDSGHSASEKFALGNTRTIRKDFLKDSLENNPYLDQLGAGTTVTSAEDMGFQKMIDEYSEDENSERDNGEDNYSTDEDQLTDTGLEPELRKVLSGHSDDEFMSPTSTGYEPSLRKVVDQFSDTDDSQSPTNSGYEPSLRRVIDQYSDADDAQSPLNTGFEPSLRRVVDQHSDSDSSKSDSRSFVSAKEKVFEGNKQDPTGKTELSTTFTHPITSVSSPVPINKTSEFGTTRTGLDLSNDLESNESPNSTAYISHSQIPSETGTSIDSTGEWRRRPPKPSPRRKIDKMSSVHTDSVSSYAPSEPENISPDIGLDDNVYSDDFEEKVH